MPVRARWSPRQKWWRRSALLLLVAGCRTEEPTAPPLSTAAPLRLEVSQQPGVVRIALLQRPGGDVGVVQGVLHYPAGNLTPLGLAPSAGGLLLSHAVEPGSLRILGVSGTALPETLAVAWFTGGPANAIAHISFSMELPGDVAGRAVLRGLDGPSLPGPVPSGLLGPDSDPEAASLAAVLAPVRRVAYFAGQYRPGLRYGDVTLDGRLDGLDVLLLARVAVGSVPVLNLTSDAVIAGNLRPSNSGAGGSVRPGVEPGTATPDGRIDGLDVQALARRVVGFSDNVVDQPIPGRSPSSGARVVLDVDITATRALSADTTYQIGSTAHPLLSVRNGATLTIPAGTRLEGAIGARLVVERTGRLLALGTALQPVVFDCAEPVPSPGCWGGVTIHGYAQVNAGTATSPAARGNGQAGCLEGTDGALRFGGCDAADSSGALRFVRIGYATDGLTLAGVGSRTVVEELQASRAAGSGISIRGGTVGLRRVLLTANRGVGLGWTEGWNGRGQFLAIVGDSAEGGGGLTGASGLTGALPRSAPQLYNLTVVTPAMSGAVGSGAALRLRQGTGGTLRNLLLVRSATGLDLDDLETCQQVAAGTLSLQQVLAAGAARTGDPDADPSPCAGFASPQVESSWLAQASSGFTSITGTAADSQLQSPLDLLAPDLRPRSGSTTSLWRGSTPPNDGFFDPTATWAGAVAPAGGVAIPWYAGWSAPAAPAATGVNVTVDDRITYQTMTGWEATLSVGWSISPASRSRLIADAVNDLGVSRIRLEISGNLVETTTSMVGTNCVPNGVLGVNDDGDPFHLNPTGFQWWCLDQKVTDWVVPMRALVATRGEPFTLNVCYVGFDPSTDFQQLDPEEYAELVEATLAHLRLTYGLSPTIWELRLEPETGFKLSGAQLGAMLARAGSRAQSRGYGHLPFSAPSNANPNSVPAYLSALLAVPGAATYLAEVGYHRYTPPAAGTLAAISAAAAASGVPTAMLEHIGADEHELYDDLTQGNVSSWARYVLAGPFGGPTGGSQLYYVDPVTDTYQLRGTAYPLRQYFKYIRPGAVRLEATSTEPNLHPVAFRDRQGQVVTVANADAASTLVIGGLPGGSYRVSYVLAGGTPVVGSRMTLVPGAALSAVIPGAGVITVAPD